MNKRKKWHGKKGQLVVKSRKRPSKLIHSIYRESQSRQDAMSQLVQAFAKLSMSDNSFDDNPYATRKATLNNIPHEIILNIVEHFAEPWALTDQIADWTIYNLDRESRERQMTLISLCKTSRPLCAAATTVLYRCAHLATKRSVRYFLRALRMRQDLSLLVKQVSCPHHVLMRLPYIFAPDAFDHDVGRLLVGGWINEGSKRLLLDQGNVIGYQDLFEILFYIPHVRTLSIPRTELGFVTGPWGGGILRLEYLTKLSISVHFQPSSRLSHTDPHPVLRWLDPDTIMTACPALQYLTLTSPYGEWQARFIDVSSEMPMEKGRTIHKARKYIESLSTVNRGGGGCVQWDLMTLQQPVFNPAYFHTLHFAGPNWKNGQPLLFAQKQQWNLNRFLHINGKGIRVLTLDWDTACSLPDKYTLFGPVRHITTLNGLTNLTHLTISLQALYSTVRSFSGQLFYNMRPHPGAEINRLFPKSLKVLRIDEFLQDIFVPPNLPQTAYEARLTGFTSLVGYLISVLRPNWLCTRGDRELWFKRYGKLDEYNEYLRTVGGGPRELTRPFLDRCISPQDRHVKNKFVMILRCPGCPASQLR